MLVPTAHPLAKLDRAPTLAELATYPLVSYESSNKPESSLRRTFVDAGLEPQLAMTARDRKAIRSSAGRRSIWRSVVKTRIPPRSIPST